MRLLVLALLTIMVGGAYFINRSANSVIAQQRIPQVLASSTTESNDPLLRPINAFRRSNGIVPLSLSPELKNLTAYRTADMISRQYYSHKTPESTSYIDLLKKYVSDSTVSCENLQLQTSQSMDQAVLDWSKSIEHRDCLLNPNLNRGAVTLVYFDDVAYSSGDVSSNYIVAFIGSN